MESFDFDNKMKTNMSAPSNHIWKLKTNKQTNKHKQTNKQTNKNKIKNNFENNNSLQNNN